MALSRPRVFAPSSTFGCVWSTIVSIRVDCGSADYAAMVEALLAAQAAALGLMAPSLGVHLGRGDACVHSEWDPAFRPPCSPLSMYVDAAVVMVQRYNPASVFVSCDDPSAASEFEVALRGAGIHISIITAGVGDIYQGRSLLEDCVGWENVESADVAWTTLRDIFMLARSEFFVVNFASQLSRVAFELAVARRSGTRPLSEKLGVDVALRLPRGRTAWLAAPLHKIQDLHG